MKAKDRRGIFANVLPGADFDPEQEPAKPASPKIRQMFDEVKNLQDKGDTLDRLLSEGAQIAEFDPMEVSPSPVSDRFDGAYDEGAIQDLIESMRERGQVSPGLVRPVGAGFQIVYGRRRLAAAKALGVKFKAIVRDLSDDDAVILQGEENANRNDLSFIEKCAFAFGLEQAGYARSVICASLTTSKSHISEMLKIVTSIPRDVLGQIGPSPDIGRRRWLEFHDAWASAETPAETVMAAIGGSAEADRFTRALAALATKTKGAEGIEIRTNGLLLATQSGNRLTLSKAAPAGFMEYLTSKMEDLHSEFMKSRNR